MQNEVKTPGNRFKYIALIILVIIVGVVLFGLFTDKDVEPVTTDTALPTISVEELATNIINGDSFLIFDLRPRSDFVVSHIPDSVSLPYYEISIRTEKLILLKDFKVVLVCESDECKGLDNATRDLGLLGYSDLHVLEGGFAAYKAADLSLESEAQLVQSDLVDLLHSIEVPEASVQELLAVAEAQDTLIIDTRTSYEFVTGFIPGAINIPLHSFAAAIDAGLIDKTKNIYVYDRVGNRSAISAQALLQSDFENVFNVTGGVEAWKDEIGELNIPKGDGSDLLELIPVLQPE